VYRGLVHSGPVSAGDLGRALGLKSKQLHAALDELHALEVTQPAERTAGRDDDRVWQALPPSRLPAHFEALRRRRSAALHRIQQRLLSLLDIGIDVQAPGAGASMRLLAGPEQAQARVDELAGMVRRELLGMHPEPAFSAATMKAASRATRKMAGSVTIYALGVPAGPGDHSAMHSVEAQARGSQYRELDQLPTKFMIYDRGLAIMRVDPTTLLRGTWEISSPEIVDGLVQLFQRHWNVGRTTPRGWVPPMSLNDRERAIIALLAAGYTDALVAEQLEISRRTIAYTLADVMERYQVKNRFQLGLVLGKEAALSPPPGSEK
jgi:DNA-binding CsgD family transcriptional regulator